MTNTELTKIREEKKLSKQEFAALLGVTAMLVGRYEKGSCAIPEEVAKKALALGAEKTAVKAAAAPAKDAAAKTAAKAVEKKVKKTVEKKVDKAVKDTAKKAAGKAAKGAAGVAAVKAVKKTAAKSAKASADPVLVIESVMGGQITPDEVLKKVPKGAEQIYIKPEENRAYWVKGKKSGSVELW